MVFWVENSSSIGLWCRWYPENPIIPVTYFPSFFSLTVEYTCVSNTQLRQNATCCLSPNLTSIAFTTFQSPKFFFIALITFHRSPLLANLGLEDKWKIYP